MTDLLSSQARKWLHPFEPSLFYRLMGDDGNVLGHEGSLRSGQHCGHSVRQGREGSMVDDDHFPLPRQSLPTADTCLLMTHLSALGSHVIVSPDFPCDVGPTLTAGIWEQYLQESIVRLGLVWALVGQKPQGVGLSCHLRNRPTCCGDSRMWWHVWVLLAQIEVPLLFL